LRENSGAKMDGIPQTAWRHSGKANVNLIRHFALFAISLLTIPIWAAVGGRIVGTITDPTKAVIADADITVTNEATGIVKRAKSDSRGAFSFEDLTVGTYDLQIEKQGFKVYHKVGITLDANAAIGADATLELGAATQEVTVSSNSVQVDTTSTQLGQVIDDQKMTTVPLNGRSFLNLLALQPGVAPGSSGVTGYALLSTAGQLSINGGREASNAFMVNGALVEEGNANSAGLTPNLDSIAEFRILTNGFDAEYGQFSGGQVNVITKSGGAKFHGDVFEFLRNADLDARNFYSADRGKYIQNQFGGTVGGPILRKKNLFFFADYQGTRQDIGQNTGLIPVPSAAERSGDLSGVASELTGSVAGNYWANQLSQNLGYTVTAGEPYYTPGCTSNKACVFPNAIIPAGAIDPISVNLMQYIPEINTPGGYYSTSAFNLLDNDNEEAVRIDWTLGRHAVSGYYYQDKYTETQPYFDDNLPGFGANTTQGTRLIDLSDVTTISATALNEARVWYFRLTPRSYPTGGVGETLTSLGFPSPADGGPINNLPQLAGAPTISLNEFSFGVDSFFENSWSHNTFGLLDNFSLIRGTHSFKFGGEGIYAQINLHLTADNNPSYGFNGTETGLDFADFLVGAPDVFYQGVEAPLYSRNKYFGIYAEDSWRALPNLTVNYGLRWDVPPPWSANPPEIETIVPGEQSVVFPGAPTGWVFPGDPGIPKTLAPTRYNNLAPRIGLAYAPAASGGMLSRLLGSPGETSIRAAFGIFYSSIENVAALNTNGAAPYGFFWYSPSPPLFGTPFVDRQTGFNNGQRFPVTFPTPPTAQNPNNTVNWPQYLPIASSPGYWYKNRVPYAEQFNFSIQRQLGQHSVIMANYVGTVGRQLLTNVEANPGDAALCLSVSQISQVAPGSATCGPNGENGVYTTASGTVINSTRGPLGPDFASDNYIITLASSSYNSAQFSWQYRTGPLEFLAGYTWSKAMDNGSGFGDNTNPFNHLASYGLSGFNVPQNFVLSYHYELPIGRLGGPKMLTNGWVLSGIARFASGSPVSISEQDDNSLEGTSGGGNGYGTDVPNYTPGRLNRGANPRACVNNPSCQPYFNTNLFSKEIVGYIGNSMPRFFSGPGINNFDTALLKDTHFNEGIVLEARFEFFNTLNHSQFLNPSGNINNNAFGVVTGAQNPRIGQVALKLIF
jgi:Carboxypeptidase regulatory-like domain